MKNEECRMKNVFYLHPDGMILHSTFFILHLVYFTMTFLPFTIYKPGRVMLLTRWPERV